MVSTQHFDRCSSGSSLDGTTIVIIKNIYNMLDIILGIFIGIFIMVIILGLACYSIYKECKEEIKNINK